MKFAKTVALIMSLMMLSGVFMFAAKAASFPNLPTTPVTIEVTSGAYVFPITIVLSNVPPGYDVNNQAYIGYCADLLTIIHVSTLYSATLVSSLTLGVQWNEINYILNNVPAGATGLDIQAAIWFVQGPFTDAQVLSDAHFTPTALSHTMASNAQSFGSTFVPGPGQIVAVEIVSASQNLLIPLTEPPTHHGDVYVPPGPPNSMSEWTTPSLRVFDMNASHAKVGWLYSNDPMYNVTSEKTYPKIDYSSPLVIGKTSIGFGTTVMVLGFIPGVTASMDATPPPVELTITWNGVPNTVTLTTTRTVGALVPATIFPDIGTVYQAAYPGKEGGVNINKNAFYNVYVGPYSSVLMAEFGITSPPAWTYTDYGLWFWYKFTPNVGDYISYNCDGKIMDPPTYDITALLEYGTSQVWFNHICFNVNFLQIHKTVSYIDGQFYPSKTNNAAEALDNLVIQNVGLIPATGLKVIETFPTTSKYGVQPDNVAGTAWAILSGCGPTSGDEAQINYFSYAINGSWTTLQAPFNTLYPGENLTINQYLQVFEEISGTTLPTPGTLKPASDDGTAGLTSLPYSVNIIFDSMCAANEIPAWKDPIGLYSLAIGTPNGSPVELFDGMELKVSKEPDLVGDPTIETLTIASFKIVSEWPVATPWLRFQLTEAPFVMVLDPVPVSLSGASSVNSADVNLVRQAICGLAPYDARMDLTAKGYVNLQDLAAYKTAAGQ